MMQIRTKDADEAAFFWIQKGVEFQSCEVRTDYNRKSLWFVFNMDMTEMEFQQLRNDFRNGKIGPITLEFVKEYDNEA